MMHHQKPWCQLLFCATIALFLFPSGSNGRHPSRDNNNNNIALSWHLNSVVANAFKAHGVTVAVDKYAANVHPLEYPIMIHGTSALRSLSDDNNINNNNNNNNMASDDSCHEMVQRKLSNNKDNDDTKAQVALLLLLAGHGDAAHDVLLGATLDNLKDAEYAATHRGQTNWAQEHPLSDLEDVLHSLIHRIYEGSRVGEGGYTGYENAQYWCAGGPKQYQEPIMAREMKIMNKNAARIPTSTGVLAKVYQELCQLALKKAPICVSRGIIAQASPPGTTASKHHDADDNKSAAGTVIHSIIAGGGKFRDVHVPEKCWDPIVFCQLLLENESTNSEKDDESQLSLQQELDYLTEKELELLAKYLLLVSS
ncbi:unnamed protein product [Cylindrotheca closterium]|uniref:Uncharacterized protein n=1 Tax=Cylindrotheca closterium TaxID=2856 RepID=A0AAD2FW58_9STRA|nr:unnamed protein product [Cylindrotheca closterium]